MKGLLPIITECFPFRGTDNRASISWGHLTFSIFMLLYCFSTVMFGLATRGSSVSLVLREYGDCHCYPFISEITICLDIMLFQ